MKRFLKSILSQIDETSEHSSDHDSYVKSLEKRVQSLEKDLEVMKATQLELAKCTQQMALSLADIAKEMGSLMMYVYEIEGLSSEKIVENFDLNLNVDRKMFN
jgi:hypothetical protein